MYSVKKVPVVIQKFDYMQMFAGMDSSEACGAIFEYGVQDNHLQLIHEAKKGHFPRKMWTPLSSNT